MRERLARLTRDDVNRAMRKHLSATDLAVVIITKDAEGLKQALVADGFSPIKYDAEKPAELLAEDKVIGARKLGIRARSGARHAGGRGVQGAGAVALELGLDRVRPGVSGSNHPSAAADPAGRALTPGASPDLAGSLGPARARAARATRSPRRAAARARG